MFITHPFASVSQTNYKPLSLSLFLTHSLSHILMISQWIIRCQKTPTARFSNHIPNYLPF